MEVPPSFLDLRFKLAEAYMDLEMLGEALTHLEEILVENPNFAGARLRSGALFSRLGDTGGARREWERCAGPSPDDCRIRAYLASLES